MDLLLRIAMRVAGVSRQAAFGFEELPGFGTHFRPSEIDRYGSIPDDFRNRLKKAFENHEHMTAWCYRNLRSPETRGDPVKGFNTLKRGAIADTRKLIDDVASRYPKIDLSGAERQAEALTDFEYTDEMMWGQDPFAYDTWMWHHHDLLSHLVWALFNATSKGEVIASVASVLIRIAVRIAFKLEKLPMGSPHVYEDDVDEDFASVPEDLRNMAKAAIRSHDSIQDWAKSQSFSVDDPGDPVKQFRTKKGSPLADAKNFLTAVKDRYRDVNLSDAAKVIDDLRAFSPKYEEEAESMTDLPSSTTNNWTWYLHDVISHLLRVAEKQEAAEAAA